MTFTTLVRLSLRTTLLGSAALCFAAGLSLPPATGIGGIGTAFAQGESGHGHGGGGGYHGGGRGGSGMHGADEHGSTTGEDDGGGTHGGETTHGGDASHGGGSGAEGSSGGGSSASHGHYGGSGGETAGEGTSAGGRGHGRGGRAGNAEGGSSGGHPVWASEGIPEVELGRLNVARAPASVLNHAFSEVTANWPATGNTVITLNDGQQLTVAQLYSKPAAEFARIVQNNYDAIVRIDSPLENLSLLKDLATNHRTVLTGVTPASSTDLAAIFLGSASDKTIPITGDTVTALYTILGLQVPQDAASLAADADAVRSGINIGHGE